MSADLKSQSWLLIAMVLAQALTCPRLCLSVTMTDMRPSLRVAASAVPVLELHMKWMWSALVMWFKNWRSYNLQDASAEIAEVRFYCCNYT